MSLNSTRYVDYVFRFSLFSTRDLQDIYDRLSSKLCCLLSVLAAVTLVLKFHYFRSVSCYLATTTSTSDSGLQAFVDGFCLGHGFIVPVAAGTRNNRTGGLTQTPPQSLREWRELDKHRTELYIWMPYLLMVQALLFYLPGLVWRSVYNSYCRRDIGCVMRKACDSVKMFGGGGANLGEACCVVGTQNDSKEQWDQDDEVEEQNHEGELQSRGAVLQELADILHKVFLQWHQEGQESPDGALQKRLTLPVLYTFMKLLYLVNLAGQIGFMTLYLRVDAVALLRSARFVTSSGSLFPLTALCLVETPQVGVQGNHMIAQCSLPLNQFNQRFTEFLVLWFSAVLAASLWGFCRWLHWLGSGHLRAESVTKWLNQTRLTDTEEHARMTRHFVDSHLRHDGVFLLHMIRTNADQAVFCRLFWLLHRRFLSI